MRARIVLVLVAMPFLCAMSGSLPFDATVDDTGETFSGKIVGCDHESCESEMRLVTGGGVTCSGWFRHIAGVHFKADLTCSDGRRAEFNYRQYGRYTVTYGTIGGKRATFRFTSLLWQRPW